MEFKSAIVTIFFDLSRLEDRTNGTRNFEYYLEFGKDILSLDYPLVILCDSTTKPFLERTRKELSSSETYYIEKNITEWDFYKSSYPIIVENRKDKRVYQDPNQRNTPSYFILTMFKLLALLFASQIEELRDITHFCWVDFGSSHVCKSVKECAPGILENPKEKIGLTYIHYRTKQQLSSPYNYLYNGGPCGVAAGLLTVPRKDIQWLYCISMSLFWKFLSLTVGHSEESVLTYAVSMYPEKFDISFGDYYSLYTNYHYVTRDYQSVKRFFIQNCIRDGNKEYVENAARNILESHEKNLLSLDLKEVDYLKGLCRS